MLFEKLKIGLASLRELVFASTGGALGFWIYLVAFVLVIFVLGKPLSKHVFGKELGSARIMIACLLPFVGALIAWGFSVAFSEPDIKLQTPVEMWVSIGVAALAGLIIVGLLTRPLLKLKYFMTVVFLSLAYLAAAGGVYVAKSAVEAYQTGGSIIEKSQKRPLAE